MTNRELFDKVKDHLLRQGKKAEIYPGGQCRYRADGGLKCAVGCLIPDEMYHVNIENVSMASFSISGGKFAPPEEENGFRGGRYNSQLLASILNDVIHDPDGQTLKLLKELQNVHDSVHPDDWAYHLDVIERAEFGAT